MRECVFVVNKYTKIAARSYIYFLLTYARDFFLLTSTIEQKSPSKMGSRVSSRFFLLVTRRKCEICRFILQNKNENPMCVCVSLFLLMVDLI